MQRLLLLLLLVLPTQRLSADRPNVLFIAVDDLRPELACYGRQYIHSPNINRLAKGGVLFERAYCMVPTCGASRASLMTGVRPSRNRFVNWLTWAERDAPGITTFNSQFRTNGYRNGDTIRTNAFRFTEYSNDKGQQTSRMLYDHKHDPSENTNVAEVHMDSTSDLAEQLHRLMGRNKSPAK